MSDNNYLPAVQDAVVEALGLETEEVTPDSTLTGDLGAESIDLLDILFRIERATGAKIQASDLADHIQGGIPDAEFGTDDDMVSDLGLAHLQAVMPQIHIADLVGKLPADEVISLFTVRNLADMVTRFAPLGSG
ncbi:acyl carrier protein [Solihabitans fulvus]|uniref:Acyl carrier protein n=1 Tax=Solihabitans fulvus TaxID=1892852 RepID=A0A5B2XHL2_9PSEU|nr:acyl carrier protein [Solihabitans fulvus]KAA2262696.1 acyl carrier protein [Solihabitans fulvus]